jgi:hypothetical protein|tara:strand:+ start:170 stop:628 length:459 start_codon:yes stop_codon:yes gene_type:complete
MGYTHYWNIYEKEIPQNIWFDFAHDFVKVLPHFYKLLDNTTDQKFRVDSESIIFNGIGEQGHETFTMNRKNPMEKSYNDKYEYFDFCKTARKEYDIAVCCALIVAKKHFGDIINISSDGNNEELEEANSLCKNILKYSNFNIDNESGNGEFI